MSPYVFLVTLTAATFGISCGPLPEYEDASPAPPEETIGAAQSDLSAANALWWRTLRQDQRTQLILDRAGRDLWAYVGLECKPWVQRVVTEASHGAAIVPLTAPDAEGWYWQPNPYAVGMSIDIRNVQPGWMLQMRIRHVDGSYGPHTAIVYLKTTEGMWWVDSNWQHDDVVREHYLSFADFLSATMEHGMNRYSVYYIGGA